MKIEKFEDIKAWQKALELKYISEDNFHNLYDTSVEISKMLFGFIKTLRTL